MRHLQVADVRGSIRAAKARNRRITEEIIFNIIVFAAGDHSWHRYIQELSIQKGTRFLAGRR